MIIIIFGLAASGKNYVGEILSKHFGFQHEDADNWLTPDMQNYIIEKKTFSIEMLENFTHIIAKNIESLKNKHKNIVITQALYRQKNRLYLKNYFKNENIIFIQTESNEDIIYQRLVKRNNLVTPEYANSILQYFEPMDGSYVIKNYNEGDNHIIKQLNNILKFSKI
jgi:shikimate kinase